MIAMTTNSSTRVNPRCGELQNANGRFRSVAFKIPILRFTIPFLFLMYRSTESTIGSTLSASQRTDVEDRITQIMVGEDPRLHSAYPRRQRESHLSNLPFNSNNGGQASEKPAKKRIPYKNSPSARWLVTLVRKAPLTRHRSNPKVQKPLHLLTRVNTNLSDDRFPKKNPRSPPSPRP